MLLALGHMIPFSNVLRVPGLVTLANSSIKLEKSPVGQSIENNRWEGNDGRWGLYAVE